MILKIGSIDVSMYATNFVDTETPRGENVEYTLNGTTCVDRIGGYKHRLTFTLGALKLSVYSSLKTALKTLPFDVTFSTGGATATTKSFRVDGDLPAPYSYTDSGGDHVMDISLTLEEM